MHTGGGVSERRRDGFFYGLFMDVDVLKAIGVEGCNPRRAYVDGYALRIGKRATLVRSRGDRAYGMVFALTDRDFSQLYDAPGLEEYHPEELPVQVLGADAQYALCYNLRRAPSPSEANAEYAAQLRVVLGNLAFPAEYAESVR